MSDPSHLALRAFLDQPDAVIFVGSGLSRWAGLPTWEDLIARLIDLAETKNISVRVAREALDNNQLLECADALPLTPIEVAEALRIPLGFAKATPHNVHSLLTRLGPHRFVTTNYDSLIEQQLGLDGALGRFRVVTNRQVAELADIMKASADHFVFKAHGDVSDAESIVLASRDYERVFIGDNNHTRWALETLLVTRPILFLGYGLRDPDTNLVLRTLRDRYRGNIGHFMAIVADAAPEHQDYWWDRYRIRVVSYETSPAKDGIRDHSSFVKLLTALVTLKSRGKTGTGREKDREKRSRPGNSLRSRQGDAALIRYAARLIQPDPRIRFPLRVTIDRHNWTRFADDVHSYEHKSIDHVFDHFRKSFILEGSAGAGKSYALASYLSRIGHRLVQLDDKPDDIDSIPIPVLLDTRLYDGSFARLAEGTVPKGVDLVSISKSREILIIVDSVDEMPASQLDAGYWKADINQFVGQMKHARVIYSTRRHALIDRFDLPVFVLTGVSEDVVQDVLAEIGVQFGDYAREFRHALRSPFVLSMGRRLLARYRDVQSTFDLLSRHIRLATAVLHPDTARLAADRQLRKLAVSLIEAGRETIALQDAAQHLSVNARTGSHSGHVVIDELVAAGIMSSEVNNSVRFAHRIITEYLGALEVVDQFKLQHFDIEEKLATIRWDNAVVWAIQLMKDTEVEQLLAAIYNVDPNLARRIIRNDETGNERLWLTYLSIVKDPPVELDEPPLPLGVVPVLRRMIDEPTARGGWAAFLYGRYAADTELAEWLDRVLEGRIADDARRGFVRALGGHLHRDLFPVLLSKLHSVSIDELLQYSAREFDDEEMESNSLLSILHEIIHEFKGLRLADFLAQVENENVGIRSFVCSALTFKEETSEAVDEFALRLFDENIRCSLRTLYYRIREGYLTLPIKFTATRFKLILADISRQPESDFSAYGLRLLFWLAADPEWGRQCETLAAHPEQAVRRIFDALKPSATERARQRFMHGALRRGPNLTMLERNAMILLTDDGVCVSESAGLQAIREHRWVMVDIVSRLLTRTAGRGINVSPAHANAWIDLSWSLAEDTAVPDDVDISMLPSRLASVLPETLRSEIFLRACDPNDAARNFILFKIVPDMGGVSTDDLTLEACTALVMRYLQSESFTMYLPGGIFFTENFVRAVLLPLADTLDKPEELSRMAELLEAIGWAHDRRYLAQLPVIRRSKGT
jgi:SIR2-like domain